MNGGLAQEVALVTYGSLYLRRGGQAPDLFPGNSTFRYVGQLRFDGRPQGTGEWLARMRDSGVSDLALVIPTVDDLSLTGFVGVGDGLLWATGGSVEVWKPTWQPSRGSGWTVAYERVRPPAVVPPPSSIDDARAALVRALDAALRFSASNDECSFWAEWFREAQKMLSSTDPSLAFHPDAVPSEWPLDARRLLAAAFRSWVFGAMGSWNDVWLQDEAERATYDRVSRQLYDAILSALAAGANAGGSQMGSMAS